MSYKRYLLEAMSIEREFYSGESEEKTSSKYFLIWILKDILGLTKQTGRALHKEEREAAKPWRTKHEGIQETKGGLHG